VRPPLHAACAAGLALTGRRGASFEGLAHRLPPRECRRVPFAKALAVDRQELPAVIVGLYRRESVAFEVRGRRRRGVVEELRERRCDPLVRCAKLGVRKRLARAE
jgi:hypothetical protein